MLNAILATAVDAARVTALDQRLAPTPPYRGVRLVDAAGLRCAYRDGTAPYLIHQYLRKPWLEPTYPGVYSRLLRRLLSAADVAIRVPAAMIPPWLQPGRAGAAARARAGAADFMRWHLGDRLPRPLATKVEDRRRRREARGG